jgi:hypothetical protein
LCNLDLKPKKSLIYGGYRLKLVATPESKKEKE